MDFMQVLLCTLSTCQINLSNLITRMDFAELKVSDLEEIHPISSPSYQTKSSTSGSQTSTLLSVPPSSYGRSLSGSEKAFGNANKNDNKRSTSERNINSAWGNRSTSSLY